MANSIYEATGDGSTTDFTIPYTYLEANDVTAFIGGVSTPFTFTSDNIISFVTAPANGASVRVLRNTDVDSLNVTYSDGGALTAEQLNDSNTQLLFGVQEAIDTANEAMILDNDGKFQAQKSSINRVIKNVADPVNAQDAATKGYLENTWLTLSDKAQLNSLNLTNLNTVATDVANVNTTATNIVDVNTVVANINDVNTVASDTAAINTLAAISSDITVASTNVADISDVAAEISKVVVAANDLNEAVSEIDVVANNITAVNTVGTDIANVNTLAAISSDVSTLSAISTDVTAAVGNATDISAVSTISTDVTTVSGISSAVSNVSSISSDVTTVSAVSTDVTTAAASITEITDFNDRFAVGATQPATSVEGDLWYDTGASALRVYVSGVWQQAGAYLQGLTSTHVFTATAAQTTFTTDDASNTMSIFANGNTLVFLNGIRLVEGSSGVNDYYINSSSIELNSGAAAGDVLYVEVFTKVSTTQEASLNQLVTDAQTAEANASTSETNAAASAASASADATSTAADVVATNADVVLTNADVVSSAASAAAASTSASNAATSEANAAASASQAASSAGGGTLKITSNDTTADVLGNKLVAGTGITATTNNAGGNETLTLSVNPFSLTESNATATAAQTSFNVSYTVGLIQVFMNGVKLISGSDFTASNGTSITLASGAAAGDVLEFVVFG